MKIIPKLFYPVALATLLSSDLTAGVVLPTVANPNAQLNSGIKTEADFDWSSTNMFNNAAYFNNDNNFFNGRGIVFDDNSHGFLNAKKAIINSNKNGKTRKTGFEMPNAGAKGYGTFGAAKSYNLGSDDTVTGMGAATGNGNEGFEIFGGATGAVMNVSIQFRSKSEAESYGSHDHHGHHSNDTVIGHSPLVGNVMRLHGMGIQAAAADGRVKTNPFALESTYTQADFDATYSLTELEELINGCLFLGWLNPALDGDPNTISDGDRWVHATQGNFDNMPDNPNRHDEHGVIGDAIIGTLQDYIDGTTTSIQGLSKAAGEIRVGDHGGDANSNTVWAIIDHNSDFAVVPETSTYALIAGVISLAFVAFRRRK
jgi:hypothetical protein